MAWAKKYRIPFQSQNSSQYMIYIWENNYSGSVTTLTGAADPLVTQEDASDDIFTPIRQQTGTLRIVDETGDGSLLEALIPQNNTEKLITLVSGTWNSSSFADGTVHWTGFLCAEAFTQPWDQNKKIIEFPVKSMLAALEDVQIPKEKASLEVNIAKLIRFAFEAIHITPSNVYTISDLTIELPDTEQFLKYCIRWSMFFSEENVLNEADSVTQLVGISYRDALAIVGKLYGLTFREIADNLVICQYDKLQQIISVTHYSWNNIISMSNGIFPRIAASELSSSALLSAFTFRGNNNIAGFLQGRKSAQITLNIGGITLNMQLPQTTEDTSPVQSISYVTGGNAYCQAHHPRLLNSERYTFKQVSATPTGSPNIYYIYSVVGNSDYQSCKGNSVIDNPTASRPPATLHTGAFPCRWYYKATEDTAAISLKNGLFLNQESVEINVDTESSAEAYAIKSDLEFNISDGYLNINMLQHSFIHPESGALLGWYVDTFPDGNQLQLLMPVALKIGNYYWNGSNWTTTASTFTIPFKNANIVTNKTVAMNVEGTSGWFIPVTGHIAGTVELIIYNYVLVSPYQSERGRLEAHSRIISDLKVEFFMNNTRTASHRGQNVYRKTILQSGFSEVEEKTIELGTINNNIYAPCFLEDDNLNFIENLKYLSSISGSSIISLTKRPEEHLLDRMAAHYNQIRRTFIGVVQTGVDIAFQRFTFNGRNYFGIDKQHNWRDDTQEVKFIEVS